MSVNVHLWSHMNYASLQIHKLKIILPHDLAVSETMKFKEITYSSGADTKQGVLTQKGEQLQKYLSPIKFYWQPDKECKLLEEV